MTLRWLAVLLLTLLSGCNAPTPEPEDPYEDLPTQTYPFKVVWECTVEALEAEGFSVANSQREGEEGGDITTGFKIVDQDALSERAEAVRVRVRLDKQSEKSYRRRIAPSRFKREYTRDDWSYLGRDAEVLAELQRELAGSLRKRYRGE